MDEINEYGLPLEQPCMVAIPKRRFTIGLPASASPSERRFPLTPEGVNMLVERGFHIKIEAGAAESIHYPDNAYTRNGAEITDRADALSADIVISLAAPPAHDINRMRRGAMLLTLLNIKPLNRDNITAMLRRSIVAVALDKIADDRGNFPFFDILAEINGRAAIATASSLLADPARGKGILLGGIPGIIPCEVTILGSSISALAAARSALGLGASVKIFDNDIYSLRAALRDLGPAVVGSAMHHRPLMSAIHTADVIVVADNTRFVLDMADAAGLKRGIIIFDLTSAPGRAFPSIPTLDLSEALPSENHSALLRACYINVGSAVPRTAAMALSNTLLTLLDDIVTCEGVTNALKLTPGLRCGVLTFLGKITNNTLAEIAGGRASDINLYIQFS